MTQTNSQRILHAAMCLILCVFPSVVRPDIFTVINTNDSGDGSFRAAIINVNATAGSHEIHFNITGIGPHQIAPLTALPTIVNPVVIDGYTQPGSSANTLTNGNNAVLLIELNGSNAGGAGVSGLAISAGNSTVRGLIINRFVGGWAGIELTGGGNNVIAGNFIGTDATGTVDLGNTGPGVLVAGSSATNTIGGTTAAARNVIGGNGNAGIYITGASSGYNGIQGNFIGVDATGTNSLGNSGGGIMLLNRQNTVGGAVTGAGNVISGNTTYGINITTHDNTVQGNFIGLDVSGTKAAPNTWAGITIGVATNNLIGGTTAAARNVIAGNLSHGVDLNGNANQKFNRVYGNFIGTDVTGTKAIGNAGIGVWVFAGVSNYIGGATTGAGNLISGNGSYGVGIQQADANFVQGNCIGTDITGTLPLSNTWDGVHVIYATGNQIGGTGAGEGNVIAFNRDGVLLANGANTTQTPILGNSIFSNESRGIDLSNVDAPENVHLNDNCDADSGANNLQNFPNLTSVTNTITTVTIRGMLDSAPSTEFTLEFFGNRACDASGYGEGETYLGSATVTTAANCSNSFEIVFSSGIITDQYITATATDPDGNTSEFSNCIPVWLHVDADGDGLPNVWESGHSLDPFDPTGPNGAAGDPDGDGLTNIEELNAGTRPDDSASALIITSIAREGNNVRVTWNTAGIRTNRLQVATGAADGSYTNAFADLSPSILLPLSGDTMTNYLHTGGATNVPAFYYRVRLVP